MNEKLLPTAGKNDFYIVCKSIMSACSFSDVIINIGLSIFDYRKAKAPATVHVEDPEPKINERDLFESIANLVTMVLDFGASYISGYYIYSPMEPDDENSEYAKKLSSVNTACSVYTKCWMIKSALNAFQNIFSLIITVKKKEEAEYYNIAKNAINIITSGFSAITEAIAICLASKVDANDSSYCDEKIDKTIFICDTVGYLSDDLRAILDAIYDLGVKNALKNPVAKVVYLSFREVFAAVYGSAMAYSSNLVRTNK